MPYVNQESRDRIDPLMPELLADARDASIGEVNYMITNIVCAWVLGGGRLRYERANAVEGVLGDAAKEFYRRVVGPYEDRKRAENGDVYPPELLYGGPERERFEAKQPSADAPPRLITSAPRLHDPPEGLTGAEAAEWRRIDAIRKSGAMLVGDTQPRLRELANLRVGHGKLGDRIVELENEVECLRGSEPGAGRGA